MNPYEAIGVAQNATKDAIRRAFRRKAAKAHPDKGGSHERMSELNSAYSLLMDAERRERYDKTGNAQAEKPLNAQASEILCNIFLQAIEQNVPHDIVGFARGSLGKTITDGLGLIAQHEAKKTQYSNARGRVKAKGEANLFEDLITQKIEQSDNNIAGVRKQIAVFTRALEMLDDYESADPEQQVLIMGGWQFTTAGGYAR